ncbi:uncharacterized protein EV420DRAFT_1764881 [Desarmillaria tabescens]|uniref:Uncharacterized protein n=1 Tax=Armillaria tabescens TaxID=1929756 RepID=A0AA39N451_ARMTA|nr:uncharacterized protein EV420DRAFT_1764881 [Desarmillaria tabescens]KAK0457501.1 hypothetical protein EV420DRAFT_1764881 [Desarmillaria tabescens]
MIRQILGNLIGSVVLQGVLHGLYTSILAITLWQLWTSKERRNKVVMGVVVTAIYILTTISFGLTCSFLRYVFIDNDEDMVTSYFASQARDRHTVAKIIVTATCGGISTILSDGTMIWRCWIIWGRSWLIIICPMLCTIVGIVCKVLSVYHLVSDNVNGVDEQTAYGTRINWSIIYISLIMATTVWCTLLIIFRIVNVGRKVEHGLHRYRRIIEVVVESAALYTASLIVLLVIVARNDTHGDYLDVITTTIRGIAPTLIVGRVAAGHARPDDSWPSSALSSLRFGAAVHRETDMGTTASMASRRVDNQAEHQSHSQAASLPV